jgi:sugar lactone lactonase YvrE
MLPHRIALALALFLAPMLRAQDAPNAQAAKPILVGSGSHTYRWVHGWGLRPDGSDPGATHGCVAVDSKGRIFCNTETDDAVMVFDKDGKLLKTWGKDFRGGAHGMVIVKQTDGEFVYLTHLGRHEVVKCTLDGDVLRSWGFPAMSGIYKNADEFKPTSVAIAPGGEMFVADGYGKSWVHEYDAKGEYLKSFGGPGNEPGKMNTPHGVMIDTRGDKPLVVVADRENGRLQIFDLDCKLVGSVDHDLRRPCNIQRFGDYLVVPDLAGRVTIFDKQNKLVCHLGDNPDQSLRAAFDVPHDKWKDGEFISPHGACWDADGNLYVLDWNSHGRFTKLERVLAK